MHYSWGATAPGTFGTKGGWGYQEDPDTGFRLLGHRYYDADTGRFLTRDPIKDGRNWYAYDGGTGSPTTFADPTGLVVPLVIAGKIRYAGVTVYLVVDAISEADFEDLDGSFKRIVSRRLGILLRAVDKVEDAVEGYVYELRSRTSGECYVGRSVDVQDRLRRHLKRDTMKSAFDVLLIPDRHIPEDRGLPYKEQWAIGGCGRSQALVNKINAVAAKKLRMQ